MQDLGAKVGVGDAACDGVGFVHRVFKHDVGVAGFKLDLGEGLEELARVDLGFADAVVFHHLVVVFGDGDVGEGFAVDAFDIVGGEQVHVVVAFGQFEGDVGDDHAQRQGFDADFFVCVFALGVQELHDVRVVGAEVDGPRTLARAELVGVGEGVFEELHHGDDAGRLVFNALDGRSGFAEVAEQQSHTAATFGKL